LIRECESAAVAVIDDRGGPQPCPGGEEVETHSSSTALHVVSIDAVAAQMADSRISERIVCDTADHRRFLAETGEADGDVRLRAADMDVEPSALEQQLAARRRQAQQQLTETDNLRHRASQPPSTARMWPLT